LRSLAIFFSITFAVTWSFFLAAVLLVRGSSGDASSLVGLLVFAGTMMPGVVALALTARQRGIAGVAELAGRMLRWRVSGAWYVVALGLMAGIKLVAALFCRAIYGVRPEFSAVSIGAMLVAIAMSTPFQAGEEIGWRGYALPRLAERMGLGGGSVLLGLIWAVWHLPLFYLQVPGNDEFGQSFPVWALGVTGLSVAMAWVYARTRGSLLLVMLMHSAVNNGPHFVPAAVQDVRHVFSLYAAPAVWATSAVLVVVALLLMTQMRNAELRWMKP
jgi:membrane protease YdiL (CAAX protease family)